MVLIKCCDISNEVRPMEVSEPWVDCLLEEYFNQVHDKYHGFFYSYISMRTPVTQIEHVSLNLKTKNCKSISNGHFGN